MGEPAGELATNCETLRRGLACCLQAVALLADETLGSDRMQGSVSDLFARRRVFFVCFFPGDVVIFDNWRVLHGRMSYVSKPGAFRHLEGAYLDWDEVMSRLRILHASVHKDA